MQIRRGDIVQVDLGDGAETRGREIHNPRPSIIVQNNLGNKNAETTIVAPCSSGSSPYPFHVNVRASASDLKYDSYVLLDQLRTVDIDGRISARFGQLDSQTMTAVDQALKRSLGL